ncbi:MAG: geranylgeranyl reductase family protein [Phaeodactylibacter sp.]|nr:geranylgeranyl reductase family protein [Phaeodactylibacter sp.]
MIQTDACIVGAGPAGVATALRLSYLGIPCVLADRAAFPRDKVCGDAISSKVTTLLNRLDPAILQRFNATPIQSDVWGIKFVAPNQKELSIPFSPNYIRDAKAAPGYVSRRVDFDHFLINEARRRDNIQLLLETDIQHYERRTRGWLTESRDGRVQADARMLIVADGAHSSFSRKVAGLEKDPRHHAAAVRAYFSNVGQIGQGSFIELHFIRRATPGYFWIFPLPNGMANVGLGMRSDILSRKKFNLREQLFEIIEQEPGLKERFRHANLVSEVKGYGLPLGSKARPVSGAHYMLAGDAAHLVDPLTGEGIGNAFYSGFIAAEQLQQCLVSNDFSASFMKAYDQRISRVLGSEMRLSYSLQKMLMYPVLVNALAHLISSNRKVLEVLSGMYTDFSLREQLARPFFWFKMLFKR